MTPIEDLPPLLDVDPHVMELCGVSRGTAYKLVADGEIPSVRLGRLVKVPRDKLLSRLGLADDAGVGSRGEVVELRNYA